MRILIVTPHFYPESFKCNDMAFELIRRGHDVSVMTAIPDYPKGKFYEGYGLFKRRKEVIEGVKVYRSLIIPRGNGSAIRMVLNYISYTFFSIFKSIWLGLTKKYDSIIVFQPSPVMVGIPATIIKKIQKIPLYFWVQDLWPESLATAGGIHNRFILNTFEHLTIWLYNNSDKILISSKGFKKSICAKGDFSSKIIYFPNWVDIAMEGPGNDEYTIPPIPEGFVVMFAGNMGEAQDLPNVLVAANSLKEHRNIIFIFLGDGRKKAWVEEYIKDHGLENTVYCLGRYPLENMPTFFAQADVLFMSLKDEPIFALTVPSRIQAYMAAGKPIVAMINGEGAELINEADCGWTVPAENTKLLAELLRSLTTIDKSLLKDKGNNGKKYCLENFKFSKCMDNLERYINRT